MQQRLKPATRIARTEIVSAELLHEFLISVNDLGSSLNLLFGRIALASFTAALESRIGLRDKWFAWQTS
jgi:hypothetical protein